MPTFIISFAGNNMIFAKTILVSKTQLLETVHDLTLSLNAGNQIDLLLLDFSKAFDKVSHQRLLYKLSYITRVTVIAIQ